ncbi:hypothetical protein H7I77_01835 [Mycolicibacterium novocastrense]|uniref:Uncharacterized protein n=1 Tax=Mycolicibacterium novocastrense TaxID=59813 RepID=A0AAW5SFH0_MYCNV|nr:hypothetical protein [Mycolicibacterium novocastrense]MCV7022092.1 hypothetical protein [Mycolicibacterium novocastrense]GAT09371.1 uncharacterized protein RMCN_2504 [Mycolicibacterium novocastrense]
MTITARNNTPAARAAQLDQPQRAPVVYTQDQLRHRRRAGLLHRYTRAFDLTAEVAAIVSPLAARMSYLSRPGACWREVDALTAAVHELTHVVVGLIAERDARRKTAHLPYEKRAYAVRRLVDLAERPALPEIDDDALASGAWAATLIAIAEPYSGQLADLLAHALPPGATRGVRSASERLEAGLRVVDTAALTLDRLLDRAERSREQRRRQTPPPTETERARAELAALGIDS